MVARISIHIPQYMLEFDKRHVKQTMRDAGKEVADQVRQDIRSAAGTGRTYGGVKASAPGQTPVSRSGDLAKSIRITPIAKGMGVKVTDTNGAALSLEVGGKGGGGNTSAGNLKAVVSERRRKRKGVWVTEMVTHMRQIVKNKTRELAARPFMEIALEKKIPTIVPKIEKAIMEDISFKEIR